MRPRPLPVSCCWIFLWLLLRPGAAFAQQPTGSEFPENQLWEFGLWGAEAVGKRGGQDFGTALITMAGLHGGRVIHSYSHDGRRQHIIEYTFEIQPLFLVTQPQRAYGGGFSPIGVKWNFPPSGRFRPYVEFNGGGMFTQKDVPPGRTAAFNYTAVVGPGVMIGLPRHQALSVAVRYWHLSNANSGNQNPAFNTFQVQVGYHWLKERSTAGKVASTTPASTTAKQ